MIKLSILTKRTNTQSNTQLKGDPKVLALRRKTADFLSKQNQKGSNFDI
jgi:hypothetical protein